MAITCFNKFVVSKKNNKIFLAKKEAIQVNDVFIVYKNINI